MPEWMNTHHITDGQAEIHAFISSHNWLLHSNFPVIHTTLRSFCTASLEGLISLLMKSWKHLLNIYIYIYPFTFLILPTVHKSLHRQTLCLHMLLIHSLSSLQTWNNTRNNRDGLESRGPAEELTQITSYFISLGSSFTEGKFPLWQTELNTCLFSQFTNIAASNLSIKTWFSYRRHVFLQKA